MVSAAALSCGHLGGVPGLFRLGGHDERLAGVGVEPLQVGHALVEAQLRLLLAGDDVGRLLLQPPVLVLGLAERLLELHGGIGHLVECVPSAWRSGSPTIAGSA